MSSTVLGRNAVTVNKKYTEYFLPTVLTAMATNIAMIVDSIIAGNLLGQNSLAAINLMSPISQLYFSITILFGLGASSIISFAKGRRDEKQANRVFTSTFIVLIALSVIFIAIQLPLADSISSLLTKDAELKSLLYQYYVPFIIGTPIYLLLMCSIHFVRADARPAFASNIVIVANAVNLGLDFLFMGAFKMGIAGSSIATVTGYAVGFVMMSTHFIMKKSTLHFDFSILRNPVQFFKFLGKMVTIGLSGALGTMLITVKMLFLNTIIQSIGGSAGMVSYSVCSSSQIFMSMFITGASQTMIPIIGVCLGEKDYDGVRYAFRRAARVLAVSSVVIMLFICIEPEPIIKFFRNYFTHRHCKHSSGNENQRIVISRTFILIFVALLLYGNAEKSYFYCNFNHQRNRHTHSVSFNSRQIFRHHRCMVFTRGCTGGNTCSCVFY